MMKKKANGYLKKDKRIDERKNDLIILILDLSAAKRDRERERESTLRSTLRPLQGLPTVVLMGSKARVSAGWWPAG